MEAAINELTQQITEHEASLRLAVFLTIFALMAVWEIIAPRRQLTQSKPVRWMNNIGIMMLNSILVRLLFPAAAVGMAVYVEHRQWGLFYWLDWPAAVEIPVSLLLLDLAIYGQHVMLHYVPLFWKFHRMHHADLDLDVTSGARFHPVEILFSMVLKFFFIVLLGAPVLAVFLFETILNATSMFNHSNVNIPVNLDRLLRLAVVTPDMHRVHHSALKHETNSNFGFNFPWWDHVFRTYRKVPEHGHLGMTIGLDNIRDMKACSWLPGMLKIPFQ